MALATQDVTRPGTPCPGTPGAAAAAQAGAALARRPGMVCGDFQMRIGRDGTWYYRGSPIGRKELVCLFASVLKREEDGRYVLETPVERGSIEVEDAPFVAVELTWGHCCGEDACGHGEDRQAPRAPRPARQCLTFRTNLDEMVTADLDHPIRVEVDPVTREPRPYVTVRHGRNGVGLEARISRPVFYELVALAQTETVDGREVLGVWSEGVFFEIDDLPPEEAEPSEAMDDEVA